MDQSVKIFSRIGELMQGFLPDGAPFLVSGIPSAGFYSEAFLEPDDERPAAALPPKAARALTLLKEVYHQRFGKSGETGGQRIRLVSNIPPGKGLSSSSTDILSVLSVINNFLGRPFSEEELYTFAVQVEPTDPCLTAGIVVFRQQEGFVERAVVLPPLELLYFDTAPEQQVETLLVKRPVSRQKEYQQLLQQFIEAASTADYDQLFRCVTGSAIFNQPVLPVPGLEELILLADRHRAGLLVAHSGTIAGLLLPPGGAAACRDDLRGMVNTTIYSETYL